MIFRKKFTLCILALFFIIISSKVESTEVIRANIQNVNASESQEKKLEEGYYIITSALDKNKVLDIDKVSKENKANIQLWSKNKGTNQVFEVSYDTNNKNYKIKSALSGKVFNIANNSKKECANVELYTDNNSDAQKWEINSTSDGYFTIKSIYSQMYIDVTENKTENGTNIEVYGYNGGKNQKFSFEKIEIAQSDEIITEGFYQISSKADLNKVIDVFYASKEENAKIGMYQNNSRANQKFILTFNEHGYYSIKNLNSNLYLEVDGLEIKQRAFDNNTIAQDWILEKVETDVYYLRSRCGALYLQFNGNDSLNIAAKRNVNTQKFKFIKKANRKGAKDLENGYYIIESSINKNKVIDIDNASLSPEANALLWSKTGRNNQIFKIEYSDEDGYYKITSVRSQKVLDVAWANVENESNVQQYTSTNSQWQKWIIEKNADNTYSIISAHNGLYIDLPYGKAENGNNIQLFTGNGGKNQKFVFEKVNAVEGKRTIKDGYYKISPNAESNYTFDIGNFSTQNNTKVGLWSQNNGTNQKFKITCRENGCYIITSVYSNKALNIAKDNKTIEQNDLNYTEEQEWVIKQENNSYKIISAHNGLYASITDENVSTNSVITFSNNNTNYIQNFDFTEVKADESKKTIENGSYQIQTLLDTNKVLDITEASNESGANLEIWTNNKQANQMFNIEYQKNGYYKIICVSSGKALGVDEVGKVKEINVSQFDNQNTYLQDWIIKSCGSDNYNIISACNGLYLNLQNESSAAGTNVEVNSATGKNSEKFKFKKVSIISSEQGTYGKSGLKIKGDSRGQDLKYYKIGNGPNVYFAVFAVHGWEDLYNNDGKALTQIAEDFRNKLIQIQDQSLANKWTIYIFPSVNPDGEYYGYTHNGPGRTTLYSAASDNKGIDINRAWSTGYTKYTDDRNFNGTEPFQAYEARYLRDFLLSHKSTNGQTILVDLHGWLSETMGDDEIGSYYRNQFSLTKHIATYGRGYLINWAQANLGSNGRTARSCLVELPEYQADSTKYINATLNMLRAIN